MSAIMRTYEVIDLICACDNCHYLFDAPGTAGAVSGLREVGDPLGY